MNIQFETALLSSLLLCYTEINMNENITESRFEEVKKEGMTEGSRLDTLNCVHNGVALVSLNKGCFVNHVNHVN